MTTQPFYWEAEGGWYIWTRTKAGKRKRVFLAKSKRAAWDAWRKLLLAEPADDDGSFANVGKQWLQRQRDRHARGEVSKGWLRRVERTVGAFSAANPNVKCSQITPGIATKWISGASAAYEHSEVSTLKQILKYAVDEKLISSSPLAQMKLSKGKRREVVLTLDEHRALVAKGSPEVRCLLWFAWWTGCRPSELRHLQWEHLSKDRSQAILTEHKTAKSTGRHRVIFFPPNAQAILASRKSATGYVFTNSRGMPWTKDTLVGWLRKLRERSGLAGTAYAYRHSYATRALEQDVGVADLAEIMGTSVEVIGRNYAHLDKRQKRLAEIASRVR